MLTELYVPGQSPLHLAHPALKLGLLFVYCTLLFVIPHPGVLAAGAVLVAFGYGLAGLKASHAVMAVRPAFYVLMIIFAVQLWLEGPGMATYIVARFACLLWAASLVTFTTKASEFIDGILAALTYAPAWVPKAKIALAMSLVWRFIPMVRGIFDEVREAQSARGLGRNLTALFVPIIVRTLKSADEISEAIHARSLED